VVFKLENNTANVRLKVKDTDVYLNDEIIGMCWSKANTPVKTITPPAVAAPEVVVQSLKVLTPR
jgi:hypothetical protein